MSYANVKNAHIVPRTYLANFAIDDMIGVEQVAEKKALVMPIKSVGTRRYYYRRRRPDGTPIDDIEWSLGIGEEKATPVLRSFDERWPLASDDKRIVAELFAYQLLRGPRYKAEYEEHTRRFVEEYRARQATLDDGAFDAFLASDDYRLIRMMIMAPTLTSILASMHWTLVEFRSPVLATSDHPVVLWPGGPSSTPVATTVSQVGALECVEYRLPLSPTRGLLMTWSDKPDDEDTRVKGSRHHAANFNAFTVAWADRQWFHMPGRRPPIAAPVKLLPLSPELVKGYSAKTARASRRRAATSEYVHSKIGRDLSDREVQVVTMTRTTEHQ